jgi:hypothetical protein
MRRTTIAAPDEVLDALQAIADERHVSVADIIREALAEKAASHRLPPRDRPLPRSLGMGASGHTDTARRTGEERPEPRSWR